MATRLETKKVRRSMKKAGRDESLEILTAAAYKYAMTKGLRRRMEGATWPDNEEKYKRRKGGKEPWVNTGRTLKALTNNAPQGIGTWQGIKIAINWKRALAYMHPYTFTNRQGRKIPAKRARQVFNTLKYGSSTQKIARYAQKKGVSLSEALSGSYGPSRRQRSAASRGKLGVPPRPLFSWDRSWDARMTEDVEEAIQRILRGVGFLVK
jgi:hypothetical protein